jgi:Zn-dependent M16 (insulinase) family peptidase
VGGGEISRDVQGAYVNLTADDSLLTTSATHVDDFLSSIASSSSAIPSALNTWSNTLAATNEALLVPTQVNYVGKAANLYEDAQYALHGSSYVINKHLGMTHIWDRVRVMGGAYGGFCNFDSHSGMFQYLSYRCASRCLVSSNFVRVCGRLTSPQLCFEESATGKLDFFSNWATLKAISSVIL